MNRPLKKRCGLDEFSLGIQVASNIVVTSGRVGMLLPKQLEVNRQGLAVEWLGLVEVPLGVQIKGDVVVTQSRVGMLLRKQLEVNRQGLAYKQLGLGVVPL